MLHKFWIFDIENTFWFRMYEKDCTKSNYKFENTTTYSALLFIWIFQHKWKVFKNSICLFVWPSICQSVYALIKFSSIAMKSVFIGYITVCSLLKMKWTILLINLTGHKKCFVVLRSMKKKCLSCILMMLNFFKVGILQVFNYRIRCAENLGSIKEFGFRRKCQRAYASWNFPRIIAVIFIKI